MHVRVGAGYWKIVYTAGEEAVCSYLIPEDSYRIKKYVFSSLFKNTTFHNVVTKIIIWGLIELTGASWAFCFIVLVIFLTWWSSMQHSDQICCVISGLSVIWIWEEYVAAHAAACSRNYRVEGGGLATWWGSVVELGHFYVGRYLVWLWAYGLLGRKGNLPAPILRRSQSSQLS